MYEIFQMQARDITESLEIWHKQYLKYYNDDFSPDFWNGGNDAIIEYLKSQIERSNAIVVKKIM